ncbi:MAG: two-component system, OmpR family, phosphate regulon sensor histidine kinase PhoR [Acidobacteriota bacterium]|jgi:two-component system phosphate regulon sensor histidine kinase PhoR|nr:two-component system, OmpR family, phosphate regulon sensor histidine kinase PhoR [Acidobacteriota bacterium]
MSPLRKFILFMSSMVTAGLLVSSVWTLRTRLAIFFSLLAGVILGKLFSDLREDMKEKAPTVADPSDARIKEARRAEVRAGALLEVIMSGMREGVLVVDGEKHVVASNRAAREIFGPSKIAPEGRRLSDLTRNPAIHSVFTSTLNRREQAGSKVEMQGSGGPIFDLRVVPLRLDTEENSQGALGVFFDITRLERLERVRQEFLSNVSHELRTPLTSIIAFVETLEDGAMEDQASNRRFLSIIRKNAERMHNLIDDILELSAIEAGTVEVAIEPVPLSALVNDVLTALASRAAARRVTLNNKVSLDAIVFADARRLEQMLTNLVDNAIKFNREEGSVTIRHKRVEARDRITVIDTGDGIPPEHVKRIFERFYRVDRARSREMGGTGLGLAIVKHLARAHGGDVDVQSTPGQGSTFAIELPVQEMEEAEDSQSVSQTKEQERASHALQSN